MQTHTVTFPPPAPSLLHGLICFFETTDDDALIAFSRLQAAIKDAPGGGAACAI